MSYIKPPQITIDPEDEHEASEAECALLLLRMGFKIVPKDSEVPTTEEELLEVIKQEARERANAKAAKD
jgi:hypothetical protein